MATARPSELELQVLGLLWDHGPLTVRDVLDRLNDGKDRAYTTVLTILQVMEKKKLIRHRSEGRTHVYAARVTRAQVTGPLLAGLVRHVFGGDTTAAMAQMLDATELGADELRQLRQLIDDHEKSAGEE
jgi:predicted transcriptional regulator